MYKTDLIGFEWLSDQQIDNQTLFKFYYYSSDTIQP